MFKKLFKKEPALGDGDTKSILVRLGKLSSEEKLTRSGELKLLADSHSDATVRVATVAVMGDFESLSVLLSHNCTETAQSAAARIARDDSLRKNLARFPSLIELPHMQYSLLQYAETIEQANAYAEAGKKIDGIKLVELCMDCISDEVREWLASQIDDLKQLQALEKASRNRNKNANRFAREQIAKIKTTRDQLDERESQCERIHAGTLAILEIQSKSADPLDTRKNHLTYARINTLRNSNLLLLVENRAAINADNADAGRFNQLQKKLESTDSLLERAKCALDEQIAELTRQEQIQIERKLELQNNSDTNIEPGIENKPVPAKPDPDQKLRISMQEQDTRNDTSRKQMETSNPGIEAYQNLWRAQSTSLKLSRRLPSQGKNRKNSDVFEQLVPLNANMLGFIEYSNTKKEVLLDQFRRSLEKLDVLILNGNMTSAAGLHADCKNKSRMLPPSAGKSLLAKFNNIDKRYTELQDWRTFAATPKQLELCEAVEQLGDNPREPEAQAEHLKTLRKRWQELGRANHKLNKRFEAAASKAFAPCQAYFDEQSRIRKNNLDKRKAVLGQLRTFVEENKWNNSNADSWRATEKILRTARSQWNSYMPIDRGKIRAAQKSFDQVCEQVHQKLTSEWKKNLDQKQAYVDRARTLVSAEGPLVEIINEAKSLQSSWRDVGITPRVQDQRLWREFRKQSDKIFARRDEEKKQDREKRSKLNTELLVEYESLSTGIEQLEKELSKAVSTELPLEPDLKPLNTAYRELHARMSDAPRSLVDKTNKLGEKLKQLAKLSSSKLQEQKLDTLQALDMHMIELENSFISGSIDKLEDLDNGWQELADRFQSRLPQKDFSKLEISCKQRLTSLFTLCAETDSGSLQSLFDTALLNQTETVVRAEIEAGVSSGKSDEQLRMQMQVERLKSGLANRQTETLNPERMAIDWCGTQSCGANRQALSTRYFSALAALM